MSKRKFINNPDTITDELLEGVAGVFEEFLDVKGHVVMRKNLLTDEPKVTTMTLGGSGHEPSCLGFTGKGWEQLKVIGEIFAAPGPEAVLEGIRLANRGKGIFMYVGNHAGDIMSAKMAIKMAKKEGIKVDLHVMTDDCSAFGRDELDQRRNLMCAPTLGKMLGAAAEAGWDCDQMHALCDKYMDNVASLAVANRGSTHPVTDLPISTIPDGEMIIGNKYRILAASTAAGPAFEGGNISCGIAGVPGAIDRVTIKDGKAVVTTIGGWPPTGVCGTGVLETVYELLKEEIMDETGLLDDEYFDNGYPLTDEISFKAKDVREVQLAKAAIRAGIEILLMSYGVSYDQIDKLYLAGGFGQKMNSRMHISVY